MSLIGKITPRKRSKGNKKVVQSTQQNIPIKELVNGIIVTDDDEYIKIIEVEPTPFFLLSNQDQNSIHSNFMSLLKSAPNNIQFKAVSLPANLNEQIKKIHDYADNDTNEMRKMIYEDYENRLLYAQSVGVNRRFFIIIKYEEERRALFNNDKGTLSKAQRWLESMESRIVANLKACGNKCVPFNYSDPNAKNAEILYTIFNRKKSQSISFEDNIKPIYEKYYDYFNSNDFYLPPTEYIAPEKVNYKNSQYLLVNDVYYKFLFIPSDGYYPQVTTGWMNLLVSAGRGIDVDVFLERLPKETVMKSLRRTISRTGVDLRNGNTNSDSYDAAVESNSASQYLKYGLQSGQDPYWMSTIITVTGDTLEEVDNKVHEFIQNCKEYDLKVKEMKMQNEDAFISVLPLCNLKNDIKMKTRRNVLTEGAASTFFFITEEMNNKNGTYFGDNINNGSPVIANFFDRSIFMNNNIFVTGTTRAGKTFSLMLMAERMCLEHIPVMIIAPEKEKEFSRLATALGGIFISFSPLSPHRINIMEILEKDKKSMEDEELLDGGLVNQSEVMSKVVSITTLIQMVANDITVPEKQIINQAVIDTYERFGITTDNESLWDETGKHYKKMPIFSDLLETISHMENVGRLKNIISYFVNGELRFLNGQTNIDLNNNFIVFGLENNSGSTMPAAIFTAMDYCWSKIKESRIKNQMLFIDEWWKMAYNPIAAEYSMEIARTIAAYSAGVLFATQQMSDIIAAGDYGKAILGNCSISILMKSKPIEIQNIVQMMDLNQNEEEYLNGLEQGQALFIADKYKLKIRFEASPTEYDLIATDTATNKRITAKKRKELEEAALLQSINEAPDIDDMFNNYDVYELTTHDKYVGELYSSKRLKEIIKEKEQ